MPEKIAKLTTAPPKGAAKEAMQCRLARAECTDEPSRDPNPVRRPARLSVILPIGQVLLSGACFRLGAVKPSQAGKNSGEYPQGGEGLHRLRLHVLVPCVPFKVQGNVSFPLQGSRRPAGGNGSVQMSGRGELGLLGDASFSHEFRPRPRRGACVVSYPLGTKHGATFKYPACNSGLAR
jgi:hypothetical protein